MDRKLAPSLDLTGGFNDYLVASERFIRSLERAGASGFRAIDVPHITPNRVHGTAHFLLSVEGFTGPVVATELAPLRRKSAPPPDSPLSLNRIPLSPVTFDASGGSGDDLCLSQWLGGGSAQFRALIVRAEVYLRIRDDLGQPVLGVEQVTMRDSPPRAERSIGIVQGSYSEPPGPPPPLDELLAALRGEVQRYGHDLPPGANGSALAAVEALAGFPLPDAYAELLRATDGAALFLRRGLSFFHTHAGNFSVLQGCEWIHADYEGSYRADDDWFAIAAAENNDVVWAMDRRGVVRGLGREGIVYGPEAPFETWLADQIADLRFEADEKAR
jgi:hypothetical protein